MKAKNRKVKRMTAIFMAAAMSMTLLAGCGGKTLTEEELSFCQTDIGTLTAPDHVKIVGLGESSHGASEYQQMKAEVFKALVKNNGCRTFVIEGDFGGGLKVDAYIHGGEGTAQEAVAELGFGIYRTKELAELADWMRSYNAEAAEGRDLHFYGMDMQRYDNNKEYLFSVLDEAAPELSEEYKEIFSRLTDDNRYVLDNSVLEQAQTDALALLKAMDEKEEEITAVSGERDFAFARECANSIYESSELCASGTDYNSLRDGHMAEKVEWFVSQGDGSLIFINGHNGHIGKSSVSSYTCLGAHLTEAYGDGYFAIGTDAAATRFNSQKDSGGFEVMEVKNKNDLNRQLDKLQGDYYYLDFSEVSEDSGWQEILNSSQKITSLNVGIAGWQKISKMFYTQAVVPSADFDGMIVFREVSPTAIVD